MGGVLKCVWKLSLGDTRGSALLRRVSSLHGLPLVTKDQETLIWYAYHHSEELGEAVEAVIKAEAHQTTEQADRLYKLLKQDGGKHLSPDVFMALIDAIRSR